MSIYPALTVLGIFLFSLYFYKTLFHPVCLQAGLWSFQLSGLWVLQNNFNQVSTSTLWLIVGGVIGFGLGGSMVSALLTLKHHKFEPDVTISAKDYTTIIMIAFPIILYAINTAVPFTPSLSYFSILRDSLTDTSVINFGFIGTLVLLLNVYIVTVYTCTIKNKYTFPLAILVSVVLTIIIGAKGFLLFLTSGLLFSGYYTKKLKFRHICIGIIFLFCLFALITFARSQDNNSNTDFYINAIQTYTFSAIPALDQQINSSYSHYDYNTLRTVCLWLNKIGFNFDIPPVLAEFVSVPQVTNVFTYLYPYYIDFGLLGAVIICFLLGSCHGYFHTMAVNGNARYMIYSSLFSYPLLMQFFDDQYFRWISNWIYFAIIILLSTRTQNYKLSRAEYAC